MSRRLTKDEFITRARAVHGTKYDYSKTEYTKNRAKVIITCPVHGDFEQSAANHLNGVGCARCSGKAKKTTEEFIAEARSIHGDRYDYSLVEYNNNSTKVQIICPEHGPFWQQPNNHVLLKAGCPACKKCRPTTMADFLTRSREHHGDRYDYSLAKYQGVDKKVEIICPEHGPFWQLADSHMRGRGCAKCGAKQCVESARQSTEDFVARARAVHGDRYNYEKTAYRKASERITITCPVHGDFEQIATYHLAGHGCQQCGGVARVDFDEFRRRSFDAHGDRYDYSNVKYSGMYDAVEIICPEHGPFWQKPKYHIGGSGCPICAGTLPVTKKLFIERARQIHGQKYDYSRTKMVNSSTPVEIICPEHGLFQQRPTDHLNQGHGCPECANRRPIDAVRFLQRARKVHGDKYEYNMESYVSLKEKVDIVCSKHGVFSQAVFNHLNGSGCPRCAGSNSQAEQALAEWVQSLGVTVIRNDRSALDGFEIDIYLPEKNVGIEYHGSWWHSEEMMRHPRRHEKKADVAEQAEIRLITVWDFDWQQRQSLIKRHLLHALGLTNNPVINARSCSIFRVENADANEFYDQNHIQGGIRRSMINYGLKGIDNKLLACMSFLQGGSRRGRFGQDEWELIRFATSCSVRGGASRLFTAFVREYDPLRVWSFSDRQHFSGALYPKIGFKHDGRLAGDYRLVHKHTLQIWNKSEWQRRHIPKRLMELGIDEQFDPDTDPRTEREMQRLAKVIRIMDAGKVRWRWDRPADLAL